MIIVARYNKIDLFDVDLLELDCLHFVKVALQIAKSLPHLFFRHSDKIFIKFVSNFVKLRDFFTQSRVQVIRKQASVFLSMLLLLLFPLDILMLVDV